MRRPEVTEVGFTGRLSWILADDLFRGEKEEEEEEECVTICAAFLRTFSDSGIPRQEEEGRAVLPATSPGIQALQERRIPSRRRARVQERVSQSSIPSIPLSSSSHTKAPYVLQQHIAYLVCREKGARTDNQRRPGNNLHLRSSRCRSTPSSSTVCPAEHQARNDDDGDCGDDRGWYEGAG